MMKRFLIALAFSGVIVCAVVGLSDLVGAPVPTLPLIYPPLTNPQFSDDDYQRAALDYVFPRLKGEDVAWSKEEVARTKRDTDALRPWANCIHDPRMKLAVLHWLDWYADQAQTSYDDYVKTGSQESDTDREMDRENARKEALKKIVPVAAPISTPSSRKQCTGLSP